MPTAPPIIDFRAYYDTNSETKASLVQQIREACERHGFFQVFNHGIPLDIQYDVLEQARNLFSLPVEVKEKYSMDIGTPNLGYERLRAQNFEKRGPGDLKEGFYLCRDLPPDHPAVQAGKFSQGANKYPAEVRDPARFRQVVNDYHNLMTDLSLKIFRIIALTLQLEENWFDEFCRDSATILRLLRYPPQETDKSSLERVQCAGIGAHTDFGGLTILLQDEKGGLQVWDREASQWADVVPVPGALVVNLGNMMMRWTNDQYLSNLHRVINKSEEERYSAPFFFSGNPDFRVECIPSCKGETEEAKYPPITVQEWMLARYADTYGSSRQGEAMVELSQETENAIA
ncbi:isopenicillin N synthase family dioxygenase [Aspergillus homomorphus CBS 101889]|uniref:Oxidoreductase n=1 Tax=Aspergillus homomorphus (strain CBS 101889) TaxID=1450537 RepID=A0A395I0K0_ASPHC|nr:oxidoreductase [Aspergillus homomorphus CBS 101889]RAL12668.1 oxidoreductase [Aspergillus homomorphus CBS 101889]